MTETGDAELIGRFKRGDRAAFDALLHRYSARVLGLAQRFLGDPHEAMDVSQEVFLQAFAALPHWREEGQFFSWLYRTTLNLAYHRLREKARLARPPAPPGKPAPSPEETAERLESLRAVRDAVLRLPDRQREVFLLRHEQGLSLAEVAGRLGISLGAAKANLHWALLALRENLKPRARIR